MKIKMKLNYLESLCLFSLFHVIIYFLNKITKFIFKIIEEFAAAGLSTILLKYFT